MSGYLNWCPRVHYDRLFVLCVINIADVKPFLTNLSISQHEQTHVIELLNGMESINCFFHLTTNRDFLVHSEPLYLLAVSLTFDSMTFDSMTFDSMTFDSLTFDSLTFDSMTFDIPNVVCICFIFAQLLSASYKLLMLHLFIDPTNCDSFDYVTCSCSHFWHIIM